MTLGRIIVDLLARTGSFDTDLNRSAKLADKRAREIDKAFRTAGKTIGLALAAGATAAAIALKSTIDNMDALRDASIRLGIGVETLSAFQFAAQQTGTDIDALGKGFKLLAKNMADALNPKSGKAQIFEALGVQVADATGKLKSFEQIIPEIADKFAALEDGPTKAALALELFGKSGTDLTEFLNQGGDGIQKMIDRARELGVVFGQDAADAADAFNDKLGELKAVGTGLAIQLAEQLLPKLTELVEWAIDFTKDGSLASQVADEITSAFRGMAEMVDVAVGAFKILGNAAKGVTSDLMAFANVLQAVGKARGFDFSGALADMEEAKQWALKGQEASRAIKDTYDSFSESSRAAKAASEAFGEFKIPGVNATPSAPFSATSGQGVPGRSVNRNALNNALGGVKDSPAKKGKSGKSDEEREAERLQSAYDNLNASLAERIALFGQEGEAVKVRYDLEHGELAKLAPAQKDQLIAQAEHLDLMRAEQEEFEKSQKLAAQEAEEKLRGIEAADQMIRSMQEELGILRLTGKERERAIALRYADANATDEQRQAIADLSDAYYDAAKTADFFDEFQRGLSDTMFNVAKDFKNAGDYLWDFFESIADYLLRAKTEQWAEQIANIFKGTSGTSTSVMDPTTGKTVTSGGGGIDWWGLLSSFFSGARANGGPVLADGSYLVGERGPELFVPRTSGTIVPAAQTARMTGGGIKQTNNYYIAGPMTRQAREQARYDNARNLNRASRRNGT